jgi:RNA polymerase-interacting CarD/CdnL/TRCF family regulator
MDFRVGDPVIHWTYGLGEIVGLEERALTSQKTLYYLVRVQNLTICVPADDKALGRLRSPTSKREFEKLFAILSGPGESLSDDRLERKNMLRKELADGKAETVCRVIRDISSLSQRKSLNDDDKNVLKRAWTSLCSEWVYSLSMPLSQVENELRGLLLHPVENAAALPAQ